MAKYVMSDLHGCYDKFKEMLNLIDFKNEDELYIIGDILDRGDKPLEILDYIVAHKNIQLLKGNHEKMFQEFYEMGDYYLWYCNGGQTTHSELLEKPYYYEDAMYKYIKNLQVIKIIDKFILVHAGLNFFNNYNELELKEFLSNQDEETCLWTRENIDNEKQFKDYTIICGHTPIQVISNDYNEEVQILKRKGTIYIDCGCCFENGKLACLRLDDMKEFYV